MKILNTWFAAAFIGTTLLASPPAQQPAHEGKGHHKRLSHLQERLKLTPEQVAKVETVLDAQRGKVRALRQEAKTGDRTELREKMRAIRQETTDQLKPLLTDEQLTAWNELRTERRGHKRP